MRVQGNERAKKLIIDSQDNVYFEVQESPDQSTSSEVWALEKMLETVLAEGNEPIDPQNGGNTATKLERIKTLLNTLVQEHHSLRSQTGFATAKHLKLEKSLLDDTTELMNSSDVGLEQLLYRMEDPEDPDELTSLMVLLAGKNKLHVIEQLEELAVKYGKRVLSLREKYDKLRKLIKIYKDSTLE